MVKVYSCRFFLLFLALCGLIPVWAEKNKGNLREFGISLE